MNNSEQPAKSDDVKLADLFAPVVRSRRQIGLGTLVATAIAILFGAIVMVQQRTLTSASLEVRPVFDGAGEGTYPNGLPFAPTDIVNGSVVDQVHAKNHIEEFCSIEHFRSALVVQQSSPDLRFLNLEYEARLSDARLSGIERQRLQEEYASRRASIQPHYRLTFIQPRDCGKMPRALMEKALPEVLETWATDAVDKRGVMKLRVSVLSPATFALAEDPSQSLLIRADLLRTTINRVVANIVEVERLPGSELVRGTDKKVSFMEVRSELEDLLQARLTPLITQAGRGLGRESLRWAEHALQTATTRLRAADERAEAYRAALREYSGVTVAPAATTMTDPGRMPQQPSQRSSDVQTLTPQIDRTFIDRIVEMSATNTSFRQEITKQAITAAVEAVQRRAVVEQYRELVSSMQGTATAAENASGEAVTAALQQIGNQAKDATRRFNEIYSEFSRTSLRAGPAMYRVEHPTEISTVRAFTLRNYLSWILGVFIAAPIVLATAIFVRFHLRRFVRTVR